MDTIGKSFENDYLDRAELVKEWTNSLLSTKLNHHLVISVSGDWGTGKTYLSQNWHKYLLENNYLSCYIDSHKKDYADDPLLIIISEIEEHLKRYEEKYGLDDAVISKMNDIKGKLYEIGKKTLKFGAKTAAGIALSSVSPFLSPMIKSMIDHVDTEKIKEFINDLSEECEKQGNKYIQDRYEFINCYSKYIDDFKKSLETFTDQFDKPVIIFIDELDRCNPKFVIKLIEQLKHIFEIKNLTFILTVNKHELSNTIKGAYGSEMNGYAYYKKFITHDFTLNSIERLKYENISKFILETMNKKDGFDFSDDFIKIVVKITVFLDLSLRDIEQILDYLYYIKEKVTEEYHKEYLIICFFYRAMYVKDYETFMRYKNRFENLNDDTPLKISENEKMNLLYQDIVNKDIIKKYLDVNPMFTVLSIVLNTPKEDVFKNIMQDLYDKLKHYIQCYIISDTGSYNTAYRYILYPLYTYYDTESKKIIAYQNYEDIKNKIHSIRKNLIQLSTIGAILK